MVLRVVVYTVDGDRISPVHAVLSTEVQSWDLNYVFAVGRTVAQGMSLCGEMQGYGLMECADTPGYRKVLKHVTVHMCTTEEGIVYVPLPNYPAIQCEFPLKDSLRPTLLRHFTQATLSNFLLCPLMPPSSELYPEAQYAVFHVQDYDPWPGFGEAVFAGGFGLPGQHWSHYLVSAGEFPSPTALSSLKGILITGSRYSCYDTSLQWVDALNALLRRIVEGYEQIKIVGICFGCQLLAAALGGEVRKSDAYSFLYGVENVTLNSAFEAQFPGFPHKSIDIVECHGDIVTRLPDQGVLYGYSKTAEVEVWGVPGRVLCFQGHPDMCPSFLTNFHLEYMRRRGSSVAIEQYASLLSEFSSHTTHYREIRSMITSFFQG